MEQAELIQVLSEAPGRFSWLLGAGTSQSAGLPTAWDVTWDLKRRQYAKEENQRVAANEVQNSAVRDKINAYMQAHGFPAPGDPAEYSECFKLVFGNDYERQRRYLRAALADDRISLSRGHRVLAALLKTGAIRIVFTTNFDSVVEKAFAAVAGKDIAAFHLEGSFAALDALNNDEFPIYVKLHGDFRYQSLKNLAEDLRAQNAHLGQCAVTAWNRFGLVVAGYSGRDESVVALMHEALNGSNPFPHGLYWTCLKGREPMATVTELIAAAKAKGVKADVLEIETFDSLMSRLWRNLPSAPSELANAVGRVTDLTVKLPVPPAGSQPPILRMNALPVSGLPDHCWELDLKSAPEWESLREAEKRSQGAIICTKESAVWAFGQEPDVRKAFGNQLNGLKAVSLADRVIDLDANLFLKGFLEQALAYALKRGKPILHRANRHGSTLILDRQRQVDASLAGLRQAVTGQANAPVYGQVTGLMTLPTEDHPEAESVWWAESIEVDLQQLDGRYWVTLRPNVWIWPRWARRDATKFLDQRLGYRFNQKADTILSAWIALLLPDGKARSDRELYAFDGDGGPGNPIFFVNDRTAFTRRQKA